MKSTKEPIYLPAVVQRDACRETAGREFRKFLADHDIYATEDDFADADVDDAACYQITCRLQAPTIHDVAMRLAKCGWTYTDVTRDRVAPFLVGPAGEQVRITRNNLYAILVYTPAKADAWAQLARLAEHSICRKMKPCDAPAAGQAAYPDTGS